MDEGDRPCNCYTTNKLADGRCFCDNNCRKSMVVYNLQCNLCDQSYVGKTQNHFKKRTGQHIRDVWKVIESGRKNFGPDWKGTGGYQQADAFAKHFADHCRECNNSNEVKSKIKTIMAPSILWQGDRITCMKSAMTPQCKICMVERKEILHRKREDKNKIINDNSDIFSSCKCKCRFHKFGRYLHVETLRTRLPQKKVNSTRHSKQQRKRFSFSSPRVCLPTNTEAPITPEPASPQTPVFLIDTNVPGLPYRSPSANPTQLELAQLQEYRESCLNLVVV